MAVVVCTFYKFVAIADCEALRASLFAVCQANDIRGTILLASEGLNATVSGGAESIARLRAALAGDPRFRDLTTKHSHADGHPFRRLKIRIKPEIVTFGAPDCDPAKRVGAYVRPQHWNALISDPDVVIVDTRNAYEIEIGSFPGARDPGTRSFREFAEFVDRDLMDERDKTVAMFCTGGIRCEKASAYLLSQGFRDVRHLEGGVLKYLETVPAEESLWRGSCFVFDARVALDLGVVEASYALCARCGHPVRRRSDGAPHACAKCHDVLASETAVLDQTY
ncbi:MAG: oxygen-dependent tRNA uridine(34) hydroxylase TrhO [Hyphomicrobium sp.]